MLFQIFNATITKEQTAVMMVEEEGRRQTDLPMEVRRLADLPVEILLHIFQFLEVKFITEVLASVCSLFRCGQYGYKL